MAQIRQEENPIIQNLNIVLVVAVFTPLWKTLLLFGLSTRVTHFFRLIDATGYYVVFLDNQKSLKNTFVQQFEKYIKPASNRR